VRLRRGAAQPARIEVSDPRDDRPQPPPGARSMVFVILDSLRHDAWTAAEPVNLRQLGAVEQRWSYASWTAPSHYNLLMGLLPHTSPPGVYASEYYKRDFLRYSERLGVEGIEYGRLLPSMFLPSFLRNVLGYRTHALVSMPVLNPHTVINRDFDEYRLMPSHNDMGAMLARMRFEADRPSFYLLNVGETHYPYALPGEDSGMWPRISGVHGVFKRLDEEPDGAPGPLEPREFFDASQLAELQARQVTAVGHVDRMIATLFDQLPSGTWVVVTADHGELFGEDRCFGHGPVAHPKVLEVPFVEGIVP
jgi:hypothetical protein